MSTFADELRAVLEKKAAQLHVLDIYHARQRQAAQRLADETEAAAKALVRDVFRPLLQEFYTVLEAAGVLCGGAFEEERETVSPSPPLPLSLSPLLCRCRAAGTAAGSPHYEIRISALPRADGRIEATVECVDRTEAEFAEPKPQDPPAWTALFSDPAASSRPPSLPAGRPPDPSPPPAAERPLLTLAKRDFRAQGLHQDALRQWCAGLLKKCGQACMHANRPPL